MSNKVNVYPESGNQTLPLSVMDKVKQGQCVS
jgi:hypothetical protein